jgi:hypothetical protein
MPVSLGGLLQRSALATLWLAVALAVVAIGYFIPTRPEVSLLIGISVCLFGLTLMDSAIIPLLMVVPILVNYRVAIGGTDLTFSDAALFLAFFPAVIFAQRPYTPAMRSLVWCGVAYEVMTLFTVIANPYRANAVEWVHAGLLTVGALVVGWSIGREGHARLGLTLILLTCSALAISVIVQGLTQYAGGNFSGVFPRWPFDMHKNFAGCLLGIAAAVAYARPTWVRWPPVFAQACFWICLTGMGITQSRQAMAGLAAALIVIVMRTHNAGRERRSKVILLAVAAGMGFILVMVRNQVASGNEYNSFFQRVDWFGESIRIWQTDPLFGAGLRWWYTDRFETRFQPPNAILEMLSTAGVVGLAGFLVLMIWSLVLLWRMDPRYGLVCFVVLLSRLVQGQLDLFWVAVQTSFPFLIVGICLGAQGRELADQPPGVGQATERTLDDARDLASDKATA